MAFSTVLIIVIIGYICVYAGMIVYDAFVKKEPMELVPNEDEVVDISDEAGQFQPVLIGKDAKSDNKESTPCVTGESCNNTNTNDEGLDYDTVADISDSNQDYPPYISMVSEEPYNRKPLNVISPEFTDKGHIEELIKRTRQKMLTEEPCQRTDYK